ncbi:acyl-CoA dehydratase activase [Thermodesulfobacteriota bacterium]
MLTAGINVGAENVETAILDCEKLLGHSIVRAGWDTISAVQKSFNEALLASDILKDDITSVGISSTESVQLGIPTVFINDLVCSAKGSVWSVPTTRTVVDIGAENSSVLNCDSTGGLLGYARSSRCAAGAGAFLEEMASLLELEIEDFVNLSLLSKKQVPISSNCVVFAESEVVSFLNEGINKEDIAQAISESVTSKAASLIQGINIEKDIIFIGGVAKHTGIVDSLGKKMGQNIMVPENPCIVTAVGAALIAGQNLKGI